MPSGRLQFLINQLLRGRVDACIMYCLPWYFTQFFVHVAVFLFPLLSEK